MRTCDFLVIGAGVVGINIARELRRRHPHASVVVLEKETEPGLHASGRNSGVIHAGFYYTADSLKARFTRQGNVLLHQYCDERRIPVNRCGKLVVARDADDLPGIDELLRRGEQNGVPLQAVSAAEARAIEPRVRTFERAIFSPSTSSANPKQVVDAMVADAVRAGVEVLCRAGYRGRRAEAVHTDAGDIQAGFVVNAAGLYADRVARDFGFSGEYRILPFKGLYLYSDEPEGNYRTHVYPVPDLRNPFLGVHFTLTADGHAKIGPTAIPAFWREQYRGADNFRIGEVADISRRMLKLFFRAGFDFRTLAIQELLKYSRHRMVSLARQLAVGVEPRHFRKWGRPGIRAQLLHVPTSKLVMDFLLQGDGRSLHVLNAVSPGWTCAIPFSAHVCDEIEVSSRRGLHACAS